MGNDMCYPVGGYGSSAHCTKDGLVTNVALYTAHDCSIAEYSGSGIGDGVSCITLASRFNSGQSFAVVVDCSAPGPQPGQARLSVASASAAAAAAS